MFSTENRCIYQRNQLNEVICQLRFPEILTIGANVPVAFQEAIRDEYPQYAARKEVPTPRITGTPGNFSLENAPAAINYQFTSGDGVWRVNLTSKFISIACSRYTCWEDFAGRLDKPLAAFISSISRPILSGWGCAMSISSPGRHWSWRERPTKS